LLWVTGASEPAVSGNPLTFCVGGVLGIAATSWFWGILVLTHYLCIAPYRREFARLVEDRPVVAMLVSPADARRQAEFGDRSTLKTLAIVLGLAAVGLTAVGLAGVTTGSYTYYQSQSRRGRMRHEMKPAIHLSGVPARQMGAATLCYGVSASLLGLLSWRTAKSGTVRAQPSRGAIAWLLAAGTTFCLGILLSAMALW
jgi:hypothetical protein